MRRLLALIAVLAIVPTASASAVTAHNHHGGTTAKPRFRPNLDPGESVRVKRLPPLIPSTFPQEEHVGFHEFQANCAVNGIRAVDPIVSPRRKHSAHSHTFTGGRVTPHTTTSSLTRSKTSCTVPGDHSAYWFPTMYLRGRVVKPEGPQIVYYKSGIEKYNAVRAFPRGLRFLIGSPTSTEAEFARESRVSGWSCGTSFDNWAFPRTCQDDTRLLIRYKAPSCWDGKRLDTPNHKSHMAYPVDGVCPRSHRVAVPMLEFKIAYPVDGDLSELALATGAGYTWHADFFASWDMPTQQALVTQCINGGGQCDAFGFDQHKPERGRVLDDRGRLPRR